MNSAPEKQNGTRNQSAIVGLAQRYEVVRTGSGVVGSGITNGSSD